MKKVKIFRNIYFILLDILDILRYDVNIYPLRIRLIYIIFILTFFQANLSSLESQNHNNDDNNDNEKDFRYYRARSSFKENNNNESNISLLLFPENNEYSSINTTFTKEKKSAKRFTFAYKNISFI